MNLAVYRNDPKAWITELPELSQTCAPSSTDKTEETLLLRNEILSRFYRVNEGQETLGEFMGMPKSVRYIMITSPVIRMEDDLCRAEAFLSASVLHEKTSGSLTDTRGGIWMELEKTDNSWKLMESGWYPYASTEPWKIAKEDKGAVL